MPGSNVSRRLFVGVVGSGVISAPIVASLSTSPAIAADDNCAGLTMSQRIERLIAPLAVGAQFARWTIVQIDPVVDGAMRIKVRSGENDVFHLELMARDDSALAQKPPAQTAKFAVFVANGGDGWSATDEDHGLAAMTLASIIEKNEAAVTLPGLLTHSQRLQSHAGSLLKPPSGSAG
jgi:hypothetical protein